MESFEKFLLSLNTEKEVIDSSSNLNLLDQQDHHKAELETLQREVEGLQESANATDINSEQVEAVHSRSDKVVKELEISERQIHNLRQKLLNESAAKSAAENAINRAKSAMSKDLLNFDSNVVILPISQAANKLKSKIIKEVAEAAEALENQGVIIEFNNVVAQRSRKESLMIERDACTTLHNRHSTRVDALREIESSLLGKKKDLHTSKTQVESKINILKADDARLREEISTIKENIKNAQTNTEMQTLKYQETTEELEKIKKMLIVLTKDISVKKERLNEIKTKAITEESDYKKRKAVLQQKNLDTKSQMTSNLANLQQRKTALYDEIEKSLKEVNRYFTLQERVSKREIQKMQHSHVILAYQEQIKKTKEELSNLKSHTESYRMETERKIALRNLELNEMRKAVESKRNQLESKKVELAISESRLLEKVAICNELKNGLSAVPSQESQDIPMDKFPLKPMYSSTPRVITTRSSSSRKKAEPKKPRQSKSTRGKRGKK